MSSRLLPDCTFEKPMKLLLPDAQLRSPTVVRPSHDFVPFCESIEIVDGKWHMPPGLIGEGAIKQIGLKLYREGGVGYSYGGDISLQPPSGPKFKLSLFYVASLWPNLYTIDPAILIARNDPLIVELPEPAILVISGMSRRDAR